MSALPKWDRKKPYIPVDENGNYLQYASGITKPEDARIGYNGIRWYGDYAAGVEYITPFEAGLRIVDYYTGRSARGIVLRTVDTDKKCTMFMTDFIDYIKHGNVEDGVMKGTWTVVKRGANFGIKHV